MNNIPITALMAPALLCAVPAAAEPLKAVPATLNPAKAYILVEYKLAPNSKSIFPGSRKYLPQLGGLSFARYDSASGDVRGLGKASGNPLPGKAGPIEHFNGRNIGTSDGRRLFLIEVEPDNWVILGWGNTCFSLGSYAFTLEPGVVTDLGIVEAAPDWAEGDHGATTGDVVAAAFLGPFAKRPAIAPARVSFRPRGNGDMPVPAALPPAQVRPVSFTPDARFGNYLGGTVNRIEGVNFLARQHAAGNDPEGNPD